MRVFIDTNVLVYLLSGDAAKATIARGLLDDDRVERAISAQVIAEFVAVVRRKFKLDWIEAEEFVAAFRAVCEVTPLTNEIQDETFKIARSTNLHWYDAQIVASALAAGATRLLTEDMQDGRKVGKLTIVNPF